MKRYESYKDSGVEWIGEIPSHWETIRPQNLFTPVQRPPLDTDEIITCFRDGVVTLRKNRREDGFTTSLKEIGYQRVMVGDLVVHEMDGFEGSIGVSDSDGKSTPVYTIIPESTEHNNLYWMYLLREMANTRYVQCLSRSIRERTTEFRWNMWKGELFPLPPLSEQEQIVSFLDEKTSKIDDLIKKKEQKIELLKEYRTSLINRVITKGLNPDVPMKDSGVEWIGEIPSHWSLPLLSYLISGIKDGTHGTHERNDDGELLLSSKNVSDYGVVIGDNESRISVEEHWSITKNGYPQRNDVLITIVGSIGRSCVYEYDYPISFQRSVCFVRPKNTLNSYFLNYYFKSDCSQYQLVMNTKTSTQGGIYINDIKRLTLIVPPLPEQDQIVSYLDEKTGEIDSTIDSERKKIDLLKEYRQSLISSVITGKIKVVD